MRVLFSASLGNYSAKDAGYGNSSVSTFYVLNELKKDGYIKDLHVLDLSNVNQIPIERYDVGIMSVHPSSFLNKEVEDVLKKILLSCDKRYLSTLWETEPLPESWGWMWESDLFTGFLAPSDFIFDLLKNETRKPVYKYTYFVNTSKYRKITIEEKLKEKLFTVLYLGQYTKRKGIQETLISFIKALGEKEDCQLILKYFDLGQNEIPIEDYIKYQVYTNANLKTFKASICTLNDNYTAEKLNDLYKNSSLLLAPSRGEGFGLTPVEAMSIGIPVIYSDWSGFRETAEGPGNIPIKCNIDLAINMTQHGYENGSYYAYPAMKELVAALNFKYSLWKNNKLDYYKETLENYKIVDEKFGLDISKKYLLDIINS